MTRAASSHQFTVLISAGLFTMRAIDANSANVLATRRLVGYYGNYSLTIVAEDGGEYCVLPWQQPDYCCRGMLPFQLYRR